MLRATLATQEYYGECQRKLAWFSRTGNDVYFETSQLLWGSHTSYHKDGSVWRTNPATGGRPRFRGRQIPIAQLTGWVQIGTSLVPKVAIPQNPCVKEKDRKTGNRLVVIPIEDFPSPTINIVLEFTDPSSIELSNNLEFAPPPDALVKVIDLDGLLVVLTIIGHEDQLLIKPIEDGFSVHHYNARYSANRAGIEYDYEAYG